MNRRYPPHHRVIRAYSVDSDAISASVIRDAAATSTPVCADRTLSLLCGVSRTAPGVAILNPSLTPLDSSLETSVPTNRFPLQAAMLQVVESTGRDAALQAQAARDECSVSVGLPLP